MSKESILIRNVSKTYMRGDTKVRALEDINIRIESGKIISIMGPSGSGKSTLLNLIGALDAPTSGLIEIGSCSLSDMNPRELTEYRLHKIGFVFQNFNLIPNLSASENVELPMEYAGMRETERKSRSSELLSSVGMAKRGSHRPAHLSGGEQQRVAIARALANDPEVILADEPTGNLDSKSGSSVVSLLKQLAHEKGKTVLVVTHDHKVSEQTDIVYNIEDGRIVKENKMRK